MRRTRVPALVAVVAVAAAVLLGASTTTSSRPATGVGPRPPAGAPVAAAARPLPAPPPRNGAGPRDLVVTDLFVTTKVDTDRDGRRDVVRVVVTRPRPALVRGRRLATVAQASPYFSCCKDVANHDVDVPLAQGRPQPTTSDAFLRDLRSDGAAWARKGYAYARVASLGSNRSTGCPTIGDDLEAAGVVAFVDWLNGRAVARTPRGAQVVADGWSSGDVGVVGTSYDGTLANMAAATGVEGLRAIVPISAISSWYDYYRQDGLVVAPGGYQGEDADILARYDYTRADQDVCRPVIRELGREQDRRTGDYSDFWAARDLVPHADRVRAGVLIAHGLGDTNVKPDQAAQWYAALRAAGVPTKIWWDQRGHGTALPRRLVERWFDRFLYGVRNGVASGPTAAVRNGDRTRWYANWPRPGSRPRDYSFDARGRLRPGTGGQRVLRSFTDAPSRSAAQACRTTDSPHALSYRTGRLARGFDLSGAPLARLRLAFDRTAANVTAALCVTSAGRSRLLTQGWADPQNVDTLSESTALVPGDFYDVEVRLQPLDRRLPAGARISLVVLASDADFTLRPPARTRVSVDLGASGVRLPVVR